MPWRRKGANLYYQCNLRELTDATVLHRIITALDLARTHYGDDTQ